MSGVTEITELIKNQTLKEKEISNSKKLPKVRKPQTDEEFLIQKRQFQEQGPTINTDEWLYDTDILNGLSQDKKCDRMHILHACEKAYYTKDYKRCMDLISLGEQMFGVDANEQQLKRDFNESSKKVKKSAKLERHVVELIHIKEKCVQKLGSNDH